ncbi:hypothetical protein AVDCRST_MAG84-5141, partial [uncultured Microcoleus sp.]
MINLLSFNQQQQIVFRGVISAFIFSLTFVLSGYWVITLFGKFVCFRKNSVLDSLSQTSARSSF